MDENSRGFAIILPIILVLLLLGVGGYFVFQNSELREEVATTPNIILPTTEPTSGWKTFVNGNYSYTVNYPDGWKTIPPIVEGSKTEPVGLHGSVLLGKTIYLQSDYTNNPIQPVVQIEVSPNETQESYDVRKQSRPGSSDTTIDGSPAITSVREAEPEPGTHVVNEGYRYSWFIYNANLEAIYDIVCYEDMSTINLCNNIISSFEFQ